MKLKLNSNVVVVKKWGNHEEIVISNTLMPQPVAQFAMALIERWGMVAGVTDGEDSGGRSKTRLATEEEVVKRACKTALLSFQTFAEKDWLLEIPVPKQPHQDKKTT